MVKRQRNTKPQPFKFIRIVIFVSIKKKNHLKMSLIPEADSKIFMQKKGCFREQLQKTPSETALFCRSLCESVDA